MIRRLSGAFALALTLSAGAALAATPVPVTRAAPPVTATSQIFDDPGLPGTEGEKQLKAHGYVREEFFLSGKADVWGYGADGKPAVETRGVAYTTRVIVIRPKDPKRFSGLVLLSPMHPVLGGGTWSGFRDYLMRTGGVYVAVMAGADANTRGLSKPGAPPVAAPLVLPWFEPERYGAIRWPEEDGIRWEVFAQAAASLHAGKAGPLGGLKVRHVYATGWSFTGSFLRTYVNSGFHDRARDRAGKPLIDGYIDGISSSSFISGYVPINSHTPVLPVGDPRRTTVVSDVPVIELMSQNEAVTNTGPQAPDLDTPGHRHRLYEVPGLTHGLAAPTGPSASAIQVAARSGTPVPTPASNCPYPNTDVAMQHYAEAALDNLDRWVRTGVPAPHAPRMALDASANPVRDAQGNPKGGLRPAQLEVPLAFYGEPAGIPACAARPGLGAAIISMKRVPLSKEALAKLYPGGAADYLARFDRAVDAQVKARLLLPADARVEKAQAREKAREAFASK